MAVFIFPLNLILVIHCLSQVELMSEREPVSPTIGCSVHLSSNFDKVSELICETSHANYKVIKKNTYTINLCFFMY